MQGAMKLAASILLVNLQLLFTSGVQGIDHSQCIGPLGMESGLIKDVDIKASSSFDYGNVGPHHGRIRNEHNGGAWCPFNQATPEAKEWIEIDLHDVHVITATETQGRFGNGQGVEYAEAYMLEYYRPGQKQWLRYRTKTNKDQLPGNKNTYLEQKTMLDPPIWASKIRFLPYSVHQRTVCMRVEIYGCKWTEGIVSYSMPQGDKTVEDNHLYEFYDLAYDGHWDGEKLKNGLGQLTDGQFGRDDYRLSFQQESQDWIGWNNDSRANRPVEIIFEFDQVREFSAVHIHTNNQFTKEVQVFSELKVFFSIGGRRYKGEPISYETIEDRLMEFPRNVTAKLHHRLGRFVKLQLFFASRWMLISEITFESTPVPGNFSEEEETAEDRAVIEGDGATNFENKNVISAVNNQNGIGQYLGIIVAVFAVLVLLIVACVVYVLVQHRRYKSSPRPSQIPDKAALYRTPSLSRLTSTSSDYPDYAEPLHRPQPTPQIYFPKPPPAEQFYAATDVCKPQFTPPPPPLTTPPPVRLQRQQRYASSKPYVGP